MARRDTPLIDRLVAWVSPSAGLGRAKARAATAYVRSSYDAATPSRSRKSWTLLNGSPTADTIRSVPMLRARSRDLYRNNPNAKAAIDTIVKHTVGHGIVPRSTLEAGFDGMKGVKRATLKAADAARNSAFKAWADNTNADFDGRNTFWGLQSLARRTAAMSGDCLIRKRVLTQAQAGALGLPVPLQLQLLEPDYLDVTRDTPVFGNGSYIAGGIQFDADGRKTGYWLYQRHPGDVGYMSSSLGVSNFVPASEILHLFRQTRPGQSRGVPELHAAMASLQDLADFNDAWMARAKTEACLSVFVHDGLNGEPPMLTPNDNSTDDGLEDFSLSPGAVVRLRPGQQVTTLAPSSNGGQVQYGMMARQNAAAAVGIGYDQISSDSSQANYSSTRAARIEFKKECESDQWNMMVPLFCQPAYQAFCDLGTLLGLWPDLPARSEWMPPSFDLLNPKDEIPAMVHAIRAGLMTWQQAVMSQGYDPDEQLKALADWNKRADEAGVVLDSDARAVSQQGIAQAWPTGKTDDGPSGKNAPAPAPAAGDGA